MKADAFAAWHFEGENGGRARSGTISVARLERLTKPGAGWPRPCRLENRRYAPPLLHNRFVRDS
jgi:hypothetical protein